MLVDGGGGVEISSQQLKIIRQSNRATARAPVIIRAKDTHLSSLWDVMDVRNASRGF